MWLAGLEVAVYLPMLGALPLSATIDIGNDIVIASCLADPEISFDEFPAKGTPDHLTPLEGSADGSGLVG